MRLAYTCANMLVWGWLPTIRRKHKKGEKGTMRFMLTFRIPMEEGNAAIKDGSIGPTLEAIIDELKPEAAYFGPIEGARGGYLVVNFDEPSEIPAVAEPLFLGLGATVRISPVFTPEELPTETLQQAVQKYGSRAPHGT